MKDCSQYWFSTFPHSMIQLILIIPVSWRPWRKLLSFGCNNETLAYQQTFYIEFHIFLFCYCTNCKPPKPSSSPLRFVCAVYEHVDHVVWKNAHVIGVNPQKNREPLLSTVNRKGLNLSAEQNRHMRKGGNGRRRAVSFRPSLTLGHASGKLAVNSVPLRASC